MEHILSAETVERIRDYTMDGVIEEGERKKAPKNQKDAGEAS